MEVLPKSVGAALDFMASQDWIGDSSWYLAGGTALALQTGHRVSFDLDFFNRGKSFVPEDILKRLDGPEWTIDVVEPGTVFGSFGKTKVSFLAYPFFTPSQKVERYGNINVLQPADLAVMKLIAVSQRGRKRDFIDLYWCLQNIESLPALLERLPRQYPTVAHDYHHILKSLVYFGDAEEDPMPELYFEADWPVIKSYFETEVPRIADQLLS